MAMKFPIAVVAAIVSLAGVCVADTSGVECSITVDAAKVRFPVAPNMWGIFFEDIDLSLDGGIYAEMVRNRSFEDGSGWQRRTETLSATNGECEIVFDRTTTCRIDDVTLTKKGRVQ